MSAEEGTEETKLKENDMINVEDHPFGAFKPHTTKTKGNKKKWKPRRWKPAYEKMIMLACCGWSNKRIAEELNYTREQVGAVLNTEEAEAIREAVLVKMREKRLKDIPEMLAEIAVDSVTLLNEKLKDKEYRDKNPLALIDRGMKVVDGLGYLGNGDKNGKGGTTNITNNIQVISTAAADDLASALKKSDEVKRVHAKPAKKLVNAQTTEILVEMDLVEAVPIKV